MLERFDTQEYRYELAIEHLRSEEGAGLVHDPFSVRLVEAGRVLDRVRLFDTSCGIESLDAGVVVRGADSESNTWRARDEHCDIAAAARTVTLSEQHTALLVTLHAGFEYRYSYHYLYLAEDGRLRTLWKFEEDSLAGERSRTSVIAAPAPGQRDVAFTHLQRDDRGLATKLSATRLHFDAGETRARAYPAAR